MSSGRLAAKKLSPVQWSALTFETVFGMHCFSRLDRCNLTVNCCEVLASALSLSSTRLTALDLSDNNLKDSGVNLLSVGLRSSHCKLRSLSFLFCLYFRLHKCKLEGGCCEALAGAVSTECSCLRNLDLSANDFHAAGVKALCVGLCSHHCKLETLRSDMLLAEKNNNTESYCADLSSVLNSESSNLKTLDLSNNSLKDFGVSVLAVGLRSPHCTLETLSLSHCDLTHKSCDPVGSALSSDSAPLKELDLSGNNLQGIKPLCSGLRSQHCKLETLSCGVMLSPQSVYDFKLCVSPPVLACIGIKYILTCRLNECNLQECCADLASVLSSSSSNIKELDLSGNDLQDVEVKQLCVGLAKQKTEAAIHQNWTMKDWKNIAWSDDLALTK
uniref:Uncharacterized protein n=1 Tax=Acanthochromis polyacanthus TaxID=80966 RepID=A0A3Q1FCM6_9TELE